MTTLFSSLLLPNLFFKLLMFFFYLRFFFLAQKINKKNELLLRIQVSYILSMLIFDCTFPDLGNNKKTRLFF